MKRAYTLIELLCVIAIVSIVIAILVPIVIQSIRKGHQSTCVANQHNLALAVLQYRDDYDAFPNSDVWRLWGAQYGRNGCPAEKPLGIDFAGKERAAQEAPGYALNMYLANGKYNTAPITHPSTTILLADASADVLLLSDPVRLYVNEKAYERHFGGANYTFVDGHTKWFKPESIVISEICDPVTNKCEYNGGNDGVRPTFMPQGINESP